MNINVNHNNLPEAVGMLLSKVENLERYILQKPQTLEQPELMTPKQAGEMLNYSIYTIYTKVSKRELPCFKQGKQLRFKRSELQAFIEAGRHKTQTEIQAEVNQSLLNTKKRGVKL